MEAVRNTRGGPVKKPGVAINEFLHIRKTPKNLALAEKAITEPFAENADYYTKKAFH